MEQELKRKKNVNDKENIAKSINNKMDIKKRKKRINFLIPVLCLLIGILIGIVCTMIIKDKNRVEESKYSEEVTEEQVEATKDTMEEILEEDSFEIKTSNIDLYYPTKWKDMIRIEQVEEDVNIVRFYATVGENAEVHIFDIKFGGENGSVLGYVEDKTGEKISVNIVSYDLDFGEEWTTEDKNTIYTMLEDVNYIIGMLQKEEGFVPVS